MGTQNGHNVPFLESASLKKTERNVMIRIKQFYKISKMGNKNKSCHLVPKVVIDLPFEGRKIKGSRKYRRRERVPKAGRRGEETITELINSCIGEFHTIVDWAELKYCLHRKEIPNFFEADLAIWTIWPLQDKLEDS